MKVKELIEELQKYDPEMRVSHGNITGHGISVSDLVLNELECSLCDQGDETKELIICNQKTL